MKIMLENWATRNFFSKIYIKFLTRGSRCFFIAKFKFCTEEIAFDRTRILIGFNFNEAAA